MEFGGLRPEKSVTASQPLVFPGLLFRPAPHVSFKHIDELFMAQVDWDLIATLAADMMHVGISIRTDNILPSDILDDSTAAHAKTSSTSASGN